MPPLPQMKILARLAPNAATETDFYTVPVSRGARVQGLTVCNRSAVATSFRISVSPKGAATGTRDYLYYDLPITGNDTFMATLDTDLETGDVIRVYNTLATLTFVLYGGIT